MDFSDTEISLLTGLAFSMFYAIMGLPLGRLVDRGSRRLLIACGIALWSLVTSTCGLAANFAQLFLCRMGVGVGEAALSPGAFSMLSDLFPPAERSRAGGIYTLGVSIGAAMAYLLGGFVIHFAHERGGVTLPVIGTVAPWRFVFIVVGMPGLLVALLMLTVREPLRRGARVAANLAETGRQGEIKLGVFLRSRWRAAFGCLLGYALINIPFSITLQWSPTFLMRSHHLDPRQVGLILGSIFLGPSLIGQLAGSFISDWSFTRGARSAPLRTALACAIVLVPISALAFIVPSLTWVVVLIGAITFLVCASVGHGASALTLISPNHLRGQMTALYFLGFQIVGAMTSTTLVAVISDYILHDPTRLNVGMSIVGAVCALLGTVVFSLSIKPFGAAVINPSATAQ